MLDQETLDPAPVDVPVRALGPVYRPRAAGGLLAGGSEADRSPRPTATPPAGAASWFARRQMATANLCSAVLLATIGLVAAHGDITLPVSLAAVGPDTVLGAMLAEAQPEEPVPAGPFLPHGKGMWIYEPAKTEGGNAEAIVARARQVGLTHLYVRLGSHWDGFNVRPFLDHLLPAAHAKGIRVIGWDFPRLGDAWTGDIARAKDMIEHRTPGGHRIDGFSADIETEQEGTRISPEVASAYGAALRGLVGPDYTLVATVPRPSFKHRPTYPYAQIVESFDAVAPMVYWLNRQPDTDVAGAVDDMAAFGKPVFPVGQAYDGKPEGGRPGVPPPEELSRFMSTARAKGVTGISFWSWQAANTSAWDTIRDAPEFPAPSARSFRAISP